MGVGGGGGARGVGVGGEEMCEGEGVRECEWELGLDCGLPLCGRVTLSLGCSRHRVVAIGRHTQCYKNTTREDKVM